MRLKDTHGVYYQSFDDTHKRILVHCSISTHACSDCNHTTYCKVLLSSSVLESLNAQAELMMIADLDLKGSEPESQEQGRAEHVCKLLDALPMGVRMFALLDEKLLRTVPTWMRRAIQTKLVV